MGNEISTIGGAVATAATSVAAGVTFGQVDALNNAVIATANHTVKAGSATGPKLWETTKDLADGMPGVGHAIGGIHYACGDKEGGDKVMKAASRTTGVVLGGLAGAVGGPAGVVAGGIAGGAAMDGVTTGVESAIKKEYSPNGQVQGWTNFVNGCSEGNAQAVIGGVVNVAITPAFDALTAHGAYGGKAKIKSQGYERVKNPGYPDPKHYRYHVTPKLPPAVADALRPFKPSVRRTPWDWSPAGGDDRMEPESDEEDEARGGKRRIK